MHSSSRFWSAVVSTGLLLAGCGPTLPPPPPIEDPVDDDPVEAVFNEFQDPDSEFVTMDVRDVDGEIVRFETTTDALVWVETARSFNVGSWVVDGLFIESTRFFQVRFGTAGGERRAYFTETLAATICDLQADPLFGLRVSSTSVTVPQE